MLCLIVLPSLLPVAANIVAGAASALANGAAVSSPSGDGPSPPVAAVSVSCDGSLEREAFAAAVGVVIGALPTLWRGLRRLAAAAFRRRHDPEEEEGEEEEKEEKQEQETQEQEEEGRKRKRMRMEV